MIKQLSDFSLWIQRSKKKPLSSSSLSSLTRFRSFLLNIKFVFTRSFFLSWVEEKYNILHSSWVARWKNMSRDNSFVGLFSLHLICLPYVADSTESLLSNIFVIKHFYSKSFRQIISDSPGCDNVSTGRNLVFSLHSSLQVGKSEILPDM